MSKERLIFLTIWFILIASLIFAQGENKGVILENLTWQEAEQTFKEHKVIVIALGARCKEHGPHLPLNNDYIMAEYLKQRVCSELEVIIAPTFQYGYYPAFLEYPGSVSLSLDTFANMIKDICKSFSGQGIKNFYIINTGVSTLRGLSRAAGQLKEEGIELKYTDILKCGEKAVHKVERQEGGTHADEIETSMMLYIAPEIVDMDSAKKDFHQRKGKGPLTRNPKAERGVYSPTGVWGDPTLATREKGKIVVEAMVKEILHDIRELIKRSKEKS